MGLLVQRDRPRAALRGDVLGHIPFACGLLNHGQRSIAVRTEGITGARVEGCTVRARADGRSGNDFSASGSETAINRFEHTEKRRRSFVSMRQTRWSLARLSEYRLVTVASRRRSRRSRSVSSMLTYTLPLSIRDRELRLALAGQSCRRRYPSSRRSPSSSSSGR